MSDMPLDPDIPIKDHGSDRYGYVELINAPEGKAPAEHLVDELLGAACQDCNPNLFLRWIGPEDGDPDDRPNWYVTAAHDETCPTYARLHQEDS